MATKTKTTLLVLMDSGHFKAYRVEESPAFSTPRLELLEEWNTAVTERISDQVSDQSGQFNKGSMSFAAINDMADGEQHNLRLEQRRRALKQMASRVGELLERENLDACYLAAPTELNRTLLNTLEERVRAKVQKNVVANLTRLNAKDVIHQLRAAG